MTIPWTADGGCTCRAVRYRMSSPPLVVHACHCRWCQRETGSAFALNAMIEADRVHSLGIEPEVVHTPSDSGLGQRVARCPHCRVAVWSHYAGSGPVVRFVRVGTLDEPDRLPPDVHIFTASKQPWLALPEGARACPEYYDRDEVWTPEALARRAALLPAIEAWQAEREAAGGWPPAQGAARAGASARRWVSSGSTFEARIGYARAVAQGDWVFVSGTTGYDYATMTLAEGIEAQAEQCLRNIDAALREAGASMADVVRVHYLVPQADEFERCWPVLQRWFGHVRPAATMLSAALLEPAMRIEIEVTALRQHGAAG